MSESKAASTVLIQMATAKSENSISAAFRRFDADGNGKISREELACVLKEVGTIAWDGTMIDNLFSSFDSSEADGIPYTDFVKWLVDLKWSSATLDELLAAFGSFDVVGLSQDAHYLSLYNDDEDFHAVMLKADGSYYEIHSRQKELSGRTNKTTGVCKVLRCSHATGDHLVLLKPQHEKGDAWGGGSDEWDRDIESPQDRVLFLDRDFKTIRIEQGATGTPKVYKCKDDIKFS
eukprot:TRINITY_DN18687_c0_g1_i4.p1 TRINITY_DN18687_c0_g1~~TRINITY_DN18687_c0_g1_i4.p1  ORF type:complete len:234 (+),score=53.50 TRINITY_DN18687_c0_g1_i4:108-809(+)